MASLGAPTAAIRLTVASGLRGSDGAMAARVVPERETVPRQWEAELVRIEVVDLVVSIRLSVLVHHIVRHSRDSCPGALLRALVPC